MALMKIDVAHIDLFNALLLTLTGKPEVATINSSPEGLYRSTYNLTWTIRSLEPLNEVRLLFRRLVSY